MGQRDSAKDEKNMIIKYVLIGFTQPVDQSKFGVFLAPPLGELARPWP